MFCRSSVFHHLNALSLAGALHPDQPTYASEESEELDNETARAALDLTVAGAETVAGAGYGELSSNEIEAAKEGVASSDLEGTDAGHRGSLVSSEVQGSE